MFNAQCSMFLMFNALNVRLLQPISLLLVQIQHSDSNQYGCQASAGKNLHTCGIGRIRLVGLAHKHRDNGPAEILDEEYQ